jgi:hypothetical protein
MKQSAAVLGMLSWSAVSLAADCPAWRGPTGQGLCEEKNVPLTCGANENVKWHAKRDMTSDLYFRHSHPVGKRILGRPPKRGALSGMTGPQNEPNYFS